MAWSKETRIKVFIFVDVVFFLLEIIIGYTAHSLALVADAFHMLNDVLSLCVGLWAVRVATNKSSSNEYTYGWARAEILGGLVNGVFLVALCLSIVLEAIQRFFEPQEVSNPKLVLIVGGVGLAFNILGLFVFHQHDHGHDHGDEHEHGVEDELSHAEEGHGHQHSSHGAKDKSSAHSSSSTSKSDPSHSPSKATRSTTITWQDPQQAPNGGTGQSPPMAIQRAGAVPGRRSSVGINRLRSGSRSSIGYGINDFSIHPASLRNEIISQARYGDESSEGSSSDIEVEDQEGGVQSQGDDSQKHDGQPSETSPLLGRGLFKPFSNTKQKPHHKSSSQINGGGAATGSELAISHSHHNHQKPHKRPSGGGHSHADMNIRGMFLHVLGDALGNVGVMASALIIWLTSWSFRFYFDPLISLLITLIILKSAIPLCKETAKPLLQAAPTDISVEDIIEDIESLPGIRSVHHLHVWCLTPTKRVATLHAQMDFDYDTEKYMEIAKEVKNCLRGFGIHSSTIQPEFQGSTGTCQLDSVDSGEAAMKCCTPSDNSGANTPPAAANDISSS